MLLKVLPDMVFGLVSLTAGITFTIGAAYRWKWLVDPPKYLWFCYPQSMLRVMFGSEGCRLITIADGIVFILFSIFFFGQPMLNGAQGF